MPNVTQEGLQFMLEVVFPQTQSVPTDYYIGLATDLLIDETDTLSTITEITGTNYARIAVASDAIDFPTSGTAGTNDWAVAILQKIFTGDVAGDWSEAFTMFITTVASGTAGVLVAGGELAAGRTLASANDTLAIDLTIQLNG